LKKRLVFMGSDAIALPALNFLGGEAEDVEFAAVFTQPDRPSGRGKKQRANEIKEWALARGIPVHQPERLAEEAIEVLRSAGCQLILVMAYGHILRKRLLEFPPLGTYNLHASLLPRYRGASPIQAAIASGDRETGVTLMRMVRRLDAGPVVDQESFPLDTRDTGLTAEAKIAGACVPLLVRNLSRLLGGDVPLQEQDETRASYCRKLEKSDGAIDFATSAEALAHRINALHPWPGCFFDTGGQRIKVALAESSSEAVTAAPGTVISQGDFELRVATKEGSICFLRLQRPGGRMLEVAEFLRGFTILPGTVLASLPMAPLVASDPFPHRPSSGD
jgi:methionyl-tRNA formyltransferase